MKQMKTKKQTINDLINLLYASYGCNDNKEFEEETGFRLNIGYTWSSSIIIINITFVNPFYAAQTRVTELKFEIGYLEEHVVTENEIKKLFIKKTRPKLRQISILERMKEQLLIKIRKFISESYCIDPSLIKDEDIILDNRKMYTIAEVSFFYESVLNTESIKLNIYYYKSCENSVNDINCILNYFYKKDITSITNFNPKNNEEK